MDANYPIGTTQCLARATTDLHPKGAFLGQCGWSRQKALALILKTADKFGMDRKSAERYFNDWFGKMRCPSCDTIRMTGTHYPAMNMGELGICKPDEHCDHIHNPIKYKQPHKDMDVEI